MILEFTKGELEVYLAGIGEPSFRAGQIWHWLYRQPVDSFGRMANLPLALRQRLETDFPDSFPQLVEQTTSSDGSLKMLWQLSDGERVESVLLETRTVQGRWTSGCLSTQVGCPVACNFCATGQSGFRRNLTSGEIVGQVLGMAARSGERVSRVLFMGMGEPTLNWSAVALATAQLQDEDGLAMGGRRITLSTVGTRKLPSCLRSGPRIEFSWSLHAPNDQLRAKLIPHAARVLLPIPETLRLLASYQEEAGRLVTIEYLMLADINDNWQQAEELGKLLEPFPFFVNLLPYNAVAKSPYLGSSPRQIRLFADELQRFGLQVKIRKSRGADISAACGQLRLRSHEKEKKEEDQAGDE